MRMINLRKQLAFALMVGLFRIRNLLWPPARVIASLHRALHREGLLCVSDHHMIEAAILSGVSSGGLFEVSRSFRGMYCFRPAERS